MIKSGFDISLARKNLQDRFQKKEETLEKRFFQATQDFKTISEMLISKYKPSRIYQWGSLIFRENFSEISDIDIAIDGKYSAQEFFDMHKDAESLTEFPVHLVEINKINPLHAQSILSRGKLIYEVQTVRL